MPDNAIGQALSNVTSNAINMGRMQQEGEHIRATMAREEKEAPVRLEALQAQATMSKMQAEEFAKQQKALDTPFYLDSIPPEMRQQHKTQLDFFGKVLGEGIKKDQNDRQYTTYRDIQNLSKMMGASNELKLKATEAASLDLKSSIQGIQGKMRELEQVKSENPDKWDEKKDKEYMGLKQQEKTLNDQYIQQIRMSEGIQTELAKAGIKAQAHITQVTEEEKVKQPGRERVAEIRSRPKPEKPEKPTASQKDYNFYVKQEEGANREPKSFEKWKTQPKDKAETVVGFGGGKQPTTLSEADARKQLAVKGVKGKEQDDWIKKYKDAGKVK